MEVITLLAPIIFLMLAMSAAGVYTFIQVPKDYLLKWFLIPAAIILPFVAPIIFTPLLGIAYPHKLPDKFNLVAYNVVIEKNRLTGIEVWTTQDGKTRLYRIKYSPRKEEQLKQAMAAKKPGTAVQMKKKDKDGKEGTPGESGYEDEFEVNIIVQADVSPKTQ